MIAIIKREFKSYFTNMIGFVLVAAFCFFFGLFYSIYNVLNGYPYFGTSLAMVESYLMILIPILTMKCMSDDRKSKTDQLLLTSPASVLQIVMGKFLGMVLVFAIPVVFSCIFPILQLRVPSHSLLIDYTSILAFFLFGCVYISIGMFVSSLTESQIISAVVTFLVFFLFYMSVNLAGLIPDSSGINAIGFGVIALLIAAIIKNITHNTYAAVISFMAMVTAIAIVYIVNSDIYYGALAKVLTIITFSDGIMFFSSGVFDISAIVMFISVIVLFVFLTVQSVQKRRWN